MKARIKTYVANSTMIICAQIKTGLWWNNIGEYAVGYNRTEIWCIEQAKARIQQYKEAGFDENGVIEVTL